MNNRYICKAKRKDNGKWVEGNLINCAFFNNGGFPIFYILDTDNIEYDCWEDIAEEINYLEVIPETVGQCIGRKDKNSKLIFEGDIVKADKYIFIVKFGKCGGVANDENYGYMGYYLDGFDSMTKNALRLGLRNDICYFTDIEVIGNIHDDNPELLEAER